MADRMSTLEALAIVLCSFVIMFLAFQFNETKMQFENRLKETSDVVVTLKKELHLLNETNMHLENSLKETTNMVTTLRKDVDLLNEDKKNFDNRFNETSDDVTSLQTEVEFLITGMRPHFLAFLSYSRAVSGYTIIKFEEVMTNIGNGYNKDTGFFTAPEDGIYIFGCVLVAMDGYNFHYTIYKNNNLFTNGFVSHTPRPNSNTQHVVLDLKKGDTVSIRHRYDYSEHLHGSRHSYFFGYQLQ